MEKDLDCIAFDRAMYNQGVNAQYTPQVYTDGTVATLVAKGPGGVCVKMTSKRCEPERKER